LVERSQIKIKQRQLTFGNNGHLPSLQDLTRLAIGRTDFNATIGQCANNGRIRFRNNPDKQGGTSDTRFNPAGQAEFGAALSRFDQVECGAGTLANLTGARLKCHIGIRAHPDHGTFTQTQIGRGRSARVDLIPRLLQPIGEACRSGFGTIGANIDGFNNFDNFRPIDRSLGLRSTDRQNKTRREDNSGQKFEHWICHTNSEGESQP
jgi:hypothetical protein